MLIAAKPEVTDRLFITGLKVDEVDALTTADLARMHHLF
jgi:hypothetical protein